MDLGSINDYFDLEVKTYEQKRQTTKHRAASNEDRKTEKNEVKPARAVEIQILRSNIQRYNEQLHAMFQSRKKKKMQKSLIVEKPQTVKRPQLAAIQIKSPNFLGLFDKQKIAEEQISIQRLKQKHHLLRTIHDVKQEQNKDKINSLLDQVYGRMQDEFNNQSQTRSQERQNYIQKYETHHKVWQSVPKDQKIIEQPELNSILSNESSGEEITQTPRKLKKIQQNQLKRKLDPQKLILKFPQKRWSKLRNMSYQQDSENKQKYERLELNSGKFIEQIIETGRNKKQTGDVIDKLDKIVNQIFE